MTSVTLVVQIRDQIGALERVLGLLRRRAIPVEEMSISRRSEEGLEVLLRLADEGTADRAIAELSPLVAVQAVVRVGEPQNRETRELALARVHSPGQTPLPANGRLIGSDDEDGILELTGTPEEIDDALELLARSGELSSVSRTGELLIPGKANTTLHQAEGKGHE